MKPPTLQQALLSGPLARVRKETRLLVGVSGGRDSVALLHALKEAGYTRLVVCHFNHRLRGRDSGNDARFVAALARRLGLEWESGSADVRAEAKRRNLSLETAARQQRYAFFAAVARKRRCPRLVLAHHADDQVETVLWNLFRGSGRGGLGGMKPESRRTVDGTPLTLFRPFLGIWRATIDAWLAARGIAFREDTSNASLEPLRNRFRHRLIPEMEAVLGRTIRPPVLQAATLFREEEEWLEAVTEETFSTVAEGEALRLPELRALPVPLQRRVLRLWLRTHAVPECTSQTVETVRVLLEASGPAKVNLPGGGHARRREKRLFLEPGRDRAGRGPRDATGAE